MTLSKTGVMVRTEWTPTFRPVQHKLKFRAGPGQPAGQAILLCHHRLYHNYRSDGGYLQVASNINQPTVYGSRFRFGAGPDVPAEYFIMKLTSHDLCKVLAACMS